MLGTVEPTPFDLRFSLFGIPVRVHPFFWLFSAILGWGDGHDLKLTLLWVACVFVSILIHELGHALTALAYGWPPHIVLYSFGGYASFTPSWGYTTARSVIVLFAGPGAGFILYVIVYVLEKLLVQQQVELSKYAIETFHNMEFINLWWGLVNLLPVYPLDGGQICRALATHWRPRAGVDLSLKVSLAVGIGMAFYLFHRGMTFNALLFASLAFDNVQSLQGGRFR
ncbi:MAG: site-2 protease family protein [Planctomycetia bacterium]|nr:site-2 protease family protein [Planctomycetia bacterium]